MRKQERENVLHVDFIDLEKVYDRVNRKALWLVLRMYGWCRCKLLCGINNMFVDSLAYVRVKRG